MFIQLEAIFNGGVERLPLDYEFDFSKEELGGVFPFTTPVILKGEIKNTAGIDTMEAKAEFSMEVSCDRCAEDIKPEFTVDVEHGLVASLNHEDNDDYILLEDLKLDVEQLTLEDIYLALPGKFLCKEDCKGLCSECGANLNESSCDCKKPIDPRWAALFD